MIKNKSVAAEVDRTLRGVYSSLENSIRHVNDNSGQDESEKYRHAVGKIFYTLIFDLWEPLYREHPELKPADWDQQSENS
jgi:hypothetical protein